MDPNTVKKLRFFLPILDIAEEEDIDIELIVDSVSCDLLPGKPPEKLKSTSKLTQKLLDHLNAQYQDGQTPVRLLMCALTAPYSCSFGTANQFSDMCSLPSLPTSLLTSGLRRK